MRAILLLLAFLWPSLAYSQIEVPDKVEVGEKIVATVKTPDIPEGAQVLGDWYVEGGESYIPPNNSDKICCIWALAGKVKIQASGFWVHWEQQKIGKYRYEAEVTVIGEGPGPNPPPPPPPGGPYEIAMFYQADQLDNYPQSQRSLLTSLALREKLQAQKHQVLEIFEWSSLSTSGGQYEEYFAAVRDDTAPRIAIRAIAGGPVIDAPLPANEAALMEFLADPK